MGTERLNKFKLLYSVSLFSFSRHLDILLSSLSASVGFIVSVAQVWKASAQLIDLGHVILFNSVSVIDQLRRCDLIGRRWKLTAVHWTDRTFNSLTHIHTG